MDIIQATGPGEYSGQRVKSESVGRICKVCDNPLSRYNKHTWDFDGEKVEICNECHRVAMNFAIETEHRQVKKLASKHEEKRQKNRRKIEQ